MSTQYGTLSHRRTVQVPMWLVVALILGTMAIAIGYTVERYQGQAAVTTSAIRSFPDTQVAAREGGASLATDAVFPGGLETSGVFPTTSTGNAFPDTQVDVREGTSAETNASQPIVINGTLCHQCR
jgi:hypothetical protein